jgi:hypothetical protein
LITQINQFTRGNTMEGFKNTTRIKFFKEGGFVTKKDFTKYEKKEDKAEVKADMAKDTKMVKSGVRQHESALHKGEPKTELKLKQGGRSKKDCGTVKKYKAGGNVTNVYEAKKSSGDKDAIKKVKQITPPKATAASAAKGVKNTTAKFCGGKSVKKMQTGGSVVNKLTGPSTAGPAAKAPSAATNKSQMSDYERNRESNIGKLDPAQQAEFAKQQSEATAKYGINKKKGGKIKKYAVGGSVMSDEEKNWLGGADATDPFILARMKAAMGDKKPAPVAAPVKPETSADLDPYGVTRRETSADLDPYGAASKPVAAPVRRAPAPVRAAPVKAETSADLDPYNVTRRETAADLDPYNAASKSAAPYINIPANNPGMRQFRTGAKSPVENLLDSVLKSRSQRNRG